MESWKHWKLCYCNNNKWPFMVVKSALTWKDIFYILESVHTPNVYKTSSIKTWYPWSTSILTVWDALLELLSPSGSLFHVCKACSDWLIGLLCGDWSEGVVHWHDLCGSAFFLQSILCTGRAMIETISSKCWWISGRRSYWWVYLRGSVEWAISGSYLSCLQEDRDKS